MSEFLAEASVLIQANTRLFRAELAAALATVPKTIPIQIVASASTVGATTAAKAAVTAAQQAATQTAAASATTTAALGTQTSAAAAAGAATKKLAVAQGQAATVAKAYRAAQEAVALAGLEVVGAANAEQAAQIKTGRAAAAGAAARDLLTKAELAGLDVERLLQRSVVQTAVAYGQQATAARAAAETATRTAVRQAEVTKGLQAQALAGVGLRGAIIGANPAFLAATAGAILFGKSVQEAAQLASELNVFKVVAGATADEMKRAGEEAQALGRDVSLPAVSATDAAEAFTELSKAGLSVEDSFAGAKGVLQLATAAQIDNAQATELAASALNAFGLSGDQAVHVADVLANSANDAQGSITDIGIALQQASAAGRQAGLSLEQTTGILTIFARNGIKGSDAGTLLRTLLIRLINPTDKAAKVIQKLGLNLRDASGAVNVHVFQQFADATRNLTPQARDQAAAIIAGQDAFRGLSILAREGGAALDSQTASLNKTGTAAEVAGARMSGLSGQTSALKSNLETLGTTIGQGINPFLEGMARGLNLAVSAANVAGGGLAGVLKGLGGDDFDAANANLADLLKNLNDLQESARIGPGTFDFASDAKFPKLDEAEKQVTALGAAFRALGPQGVAKFVAAFKQASPIIRGVMQDDVITPLEKAQLETTALGRAFLAGVPKSALSGLGAAIRSGLEDATAAAKVGVADLGPEIHSGIEDASREAVVAAAQLGTDMGDALKTSISDAIKAGADAVGPAVSNLQLSLAQASGNQGQELSVLLAQRNRQQKFLDAVLGRESTAKNIALANKAAQNLKQTKGAIEGIFADQNAAREKIVSDAKAKSTAIEQKAKDAQAARDKADQAVLDSFAPTQNRISIAQTRAAGTDSVKAAEAVQVLIANTASAEIAAIEKSVKNVKTRNAEIAKRVQILVAAGAELDKLEQQAVDAATQKKQDAFQAQVDLAAAEGNIPAQIRFIGIRIRAIDKLIAAGKQEGVALNKLKTERATLRQQREDIQNQQIQDQIALGQSIQDLTGNKNPLVQALDRAIAETRQDIAAAKKAGQSTVVLQTELNNFLKQRKDVIEGAADKAKDATTAFDLLKEANDTFNKSAGNLINAQQPFAGPTGFTADIAQFLIRRQQPATTTGRTPQTPSVPPIGLQDQPLIQAIEKLTDAIVGTTGNSSTAGSTPSARAARVWHSENMIARQFQEA